MQKTKYTHLAYPVPFLSTSSILIDWIIKQNTFRNTIFFVVVFVLLCLCFLINEVLQFFKMHLKNYTFEC